MKQHKKAGAIAYCRSKTNLLLLLILLFKTAGAQVIVADNFADRTKFIDNTNLTLWGGNASATSGFTLGIKSDNSSLSYNAVSLTAAAVTNSGYTAAGSLKTLTSIDYELPSAIDRNLNDIKIEFDAIWAAQDGSGENGRLVVTVIDNYPAGGAAMGDVDNTLLTHPFGRPLYNVRIRNNNTAGNGPLMLYGAGTSTDPAWEIYGTGPWWLPGFSVKSGGGSPSNVPFYPDGGSLKSNLVTTSTTIWKHYTWKIKKERMELYYRNSAQTEASDALVFFMQIPKNTSTAYVLSEINAAHGTSIIAEPPYYNWYSLVKAIRFYWRGVVNSHLANVTITAIPNGVLPVRLADVEAKHNNNILQVKWTDYSTDVKEYEIEHAVNGKDFTVIGKITASYNQTNYQFEKILVQLGTGYIRIKSIGVNSGTYVYSAVRKLNGNNNKAISSIAVFPNPVKEELYFLDFEMYKNSLVKIADNSGAVIMTTTLTKNSIELKKLVAGIYNFQIFKAGEAVAKGKFVKQ